jgi:ribosomal protein L13E
MLELRKRPRYDWEAVQAFIDNGNGFVACQKNFGFTHTAWIKAIKRGTLRIPRLGSGEGDRRRRFDWSAIQRFYDAGNSYRKCRQEFGFSAGSWTKAVRRGELRARARRIPLPELLLKPRTRRTVKKYLLEAGILSNVCEECGLSEWRGKPITIQVDHRNGIRDDHRFENLRMLCPNCHSQTDTFGARNLKRLRENIPS